MFFKEAIEGIPEFYCTGSAFPIKKWLQEIDDNAILFGWTDLQTIVVAKKLLTGLAKLFAEEDSMKVEVIIGDEMLKEVHFSVVGDNIQIRSIQDDWLGQIGDVFHTESCPLDLVHITNPHLANEILSLQKNYEPKEIKTIFIETNIILKTEAPLYQHLRRLSQKESPEVDAQIDEWPKQGIIQRSNFEYATNDAEKALKHLKHVLKRAEEYGIQINWEKCQIPKSWITYSENEIKYGVIRPSDDKVTAVEIFPELQDKATPKLPRSYRLLQEVYKKLFHNSKTTL
ncbi:hypothetical protein LAZ67_X002405 [Cordylochernes scorpioides]|uniref:Uncharacterized protein n=1 Tax=Cordylochernes scorpioides TaxID=51811 RepID=A0ABY6LUF9_9ARAC|nr:hypothetical protein LAZ67_X002405 [Cordylochernes scorpioides]